MDDNRTLVSHRVEAFNRRDLDAAAARGLDSESLTIDAGVLRGASARMKWLRVSVLATSAALAVWACGSSDDKRSMRTADGGEAGVPGGAGGGEDLAAGQGGQSDNDARTAGGNPSTAEGGRGSADAGAQSHDNGGASQPGAAGGPPSALCDEALTDPFAGSWTGLSAGKEFTNVFSAGVMTSMSADDSCLGEYAVDGSFSVSCKPTGAAGDPTHTSSGTCSVACPVLTCTYQWTILATAQTGIATFTATWVP
jgi:hypothetical protein